MKENGFKLKKARSRQYFADIITDTDDADDITLLANTFTQAKSLLHSLEEAAGGISLDVNENKMEYMCCNQERDTESDINIHLAKVWAAINRLLIIWKSDLFNKIKHNFFQAAVVLILLYGYTT